MRTRLPHRLLALVLLWAIAGAACGGGDAADSAQRTTQPEGTAKVDDVSPIEAATNNALLVAVGRYRTGFAEGSEAVASGRDSDDLAQAQAGGRQVRDILFELDAVLRGLDLSGEVSTEKAAVLTSLATAVEAFDKQNTAATSAAFLALDDTTGTAVDDANGAIAALLGALGLEVASDPGSGTAPTTQAAAAFESAQEPVTRPYVDGAVVADAAAWRDDLLRIGAANADSRVTASESDSMGIVEAWVAAFPSVLGVEDASIGGEGLEAERNGISGFTVFAEDSKESPAVGNPWVLAFAVKDAGGNCAAGVLSGYPDPSTQTPVVIAGPCTGQAADAGQ